VSTAKVGWYVLGRRGGHRSRRGRAVDQEHEVDAGARRGAAGRRCDHGLLGYV